MELSGERRLAVDRARAWEALNDLAILRQAIPGCDKVEATGPNQYTVGMAVRVGPVASRFTGKIALADLNPPNSYTISFDGQGGVAGFGRGSAQVKLAPQGSGCDLNYTVNAQVGGKIAQVGSRLIDSAALRLADDFFAKFEALVAPAAAAPQPAGPPPGFEAHILRRIGYMALGVLVVVLLLFLLR